MKQPPLSLRVSAWLRKMHGWIGLWGAILGLLFGLAGIWLNHRAVLKLPLEQQRATSRIPLPQPAPYTPAGMAAWLRAELPDAGEPYGIRVEPAKRAPWAEDGTGVQQPERWVFNFGGPNKLVQAEYWQGNRNVQITTTSNGFAATMTNLHKGTGMPIAWILLVDTLAGSMIFLAVSGVALWLLTNRRRLIPGLAILGTSILVTLGLIGGQL
jgi:hypothetical protein